MLRGKRKIKFAIDTTTEYSRSLNGERDFGRGSVEATLVMRMQGDGYDRPLCTVSVPFDDYKGPTDNNRAQLDAFELAASRLADVFSKLLSTTGDETP